MSPTKMSFNILYFLHTLKSNYSVLRLFM